MATPTPGAPAAFDYRRVVMPQPDGSAQTVIIPATDQDLPVQEWTTALWRHGRVAGWVPDPPAAQAAGPGAPRMILETNPYHPLAHYRRCVMPSASGKPRTVIIPATDDTLPVEAWALAFARHAQAAGPAPRLAVEPQFTVNLADPLQTALLEEWRTQPDPPPLVVRTYTQPEPVARRPDVPRGPVDGLTAVRRTPEAAQHVAARVDAHLAESVMTDDGAPRPDPDAAFQARFHPSERAAKDYTGSYFGVIMPQDEEDAAKADRAYVDAHREELAEIREARRYARRFRLLEVDPDTWAIWRMAPPGKPFDHGYFLNVQGRPDTPWTGSMPHAIDMLTRWVGQRFPVLRADPDTPGSEAVASSAKFSAAMEELREQWTRQARKAADVAPRWHALFTQGHTAAAVTPRPPAPATPGRSSPPGGSSRRRPAPATEEEVSHGPRL